MPVLGKERHSRQPLCWLVEVSHISKNCKNSSNELANGKLHSRFLRARCNRPFPSTLASLLVRALLSKSVPKGLHLQWPTSLSFCRISKPDGGNSRGPRKKRGSPAALQNLVKFLLSIAGKRILVLFALSIARTALSNRLARLQVPFCVLLASSISENQVINVQHSGISGLRTCLTQQLLCRDTCFVLLS